MSSTLSLEGKVAFVTGSTRGIGWSVAQAFARQGAQLIINGVHDRDLLEKRVSELKADHGVRVLGLMANAADLAQIKTCYQTIFKQFKRLDILVNNAGILNDAFLGMISEPQINKIFAINTLGSIHHLQAASRLMARHKAGSIINLSSIIGLRGNQGQVVYGASKAAVVGMTLSAAKELAPMGIRVNAVAPGLIQTDMISTLSQDQKAKLLATIGLGRIGYPEEVADAILFLASDMARYVTGQVLGVDGGMII